jgi:antitoxin VapB
LKKGQSFPSILLIQIAIGIYFSMTGILGIMNFGSQSNELQASLNNLFGSGETNYAPLIFGILFLLVGIKANEMQTAKLFANGRSQAVRLPKEYQFQGEDLFIQKHGDAVILIESAPFGDIYYSDNINYNNLKNGLKSLVQQKKV